MLSGLEDIVIRNMIAFATVTLCITIVHQASYQFSLVRVLLGEGLVHLCSQQLLVAEVRATPICLAWSTCVQPFCL